MISVFEDILLSHTPAGGHGYVNYAFGQIADVNTRGTVGFVLLYRSENTFIIRWNSYSVNVRNHEVRAVPMEHRQNIINAVESSTGFNVVED